MLKLQKLIYTRIGQRYFWQADKTILSVFPFFLQTQRTQYLEANKKIDSLIFRIWKI